MTVEETESTTVLRRDIGRRFVELRKAAGLTLDDAASKWGWSRSTLQRLENGVESVRFRPREVLALLDLYSASEHDRTLLTGMTETAMQSTSWWHDYDGSAIPKWFKLYIGLENGAASIREYDPELIPGILQTRGYAEQVNRTPVDSLDDEDVQRRVAVRLERQSLLTRFGAPQFTAVLNEAVLRRVVGGPAIMAEQLLHLLKATELPNVTVRVLPFTAGLHAGAFGGAFSFLEFPIDATGRPVEKPTVYLESPTGALYLYRQHEIATYNTVWDDIIERSLDEPASHNLITRTVEEYSRA